jgi:hypothetical protein
MFLQIFQFSAPYLLAEVTEDIKRRMTLAVANVLGVLASNVVLTIFSYTADRRQQSSVLVRVGITNFQGSAGSYASKVTQERFNIEMQALGLKSGQLVPITGISYEFLI